MSKSEPSVVTFYGIFINVISLIIAAEVNREFESTLQLFDLISLHGTNQSVASLKNGKAVYRISPSIWDSIKSHLLRPALISAKGFLNRDLQDHCDCCTSLSSGIDYGEDEGAWKEDLIRVNANNCCSSCVSTVNLFVKKLYSSQQLDDIKKLLRRFNLKLVTEQFIFIDLNFDEDAGCLNALQAITFTNLSVYCPKVSNFEVASSAPPTLPPLPKLQNFIEMYRIDLPDDLTEWQKKENLVMHQGTKENRWKEERWIQWISRQGDGSYVWKKREDWLGFSMLS